MVSARLAAILLIVIAVATPASAQDDTPSPGEMRDLIRELAAAVGDRFDLFNECAQINLMVENLSDDAADIDLTKDRVQTLAESRLRAARLYDAEARPYLYVRVGMLVSDDRHGGAYTIEVSFNKPLRDGMLELDGFASTWDTGTYGTHSGDTSFIMQGLSEALDKFVFEYLRVNEKSC